jgi:hypothetical protein
MFILMKNVASFQFDKETYYFCRPRELAIKGSSPDVIKNYFDTYDIVTLQLGSRLEPCLIYIDNNPADADPDSYRQFTSDLNKNVPENIDKLTKTHFDPLR